ncbi:MAG: sigma-70 family RNA polymerase sigma factor [Ignavibacteria bacterium]|nr:sigma-70 family RNA polymerase sigma factor [Ignavibacteria bacterium]
MAQNSRNKDYWQLVLMKFKTGDRDSFEEIYNEFADQLFAYGSKITTDRELLKDCIQDLFIDLYKYNPNIRNAELLEYYLYKSLKRLIIKKLKKDKRLEGFGNEYSTFDLIFSAETDSFPEELMNEQINLLQNALKTLDDKKRELLFLKFDSGLNYNEIGDLLDMKPDTVKKQVYRILQYLRGYFGSQMLELLFVCYKA